MLELLPLNDADLGDWLYLRELRNLPEVREAMYTDHIISKDEHWKWIERTLQSKSVRPYLIKTDKLIGYVSAYDIIGKWGWWCFYISTPGHGIGSKVEYEFLNLLFEDMEKINCTVLESNPGVIKLHKKFGFVEEGIIRKAVRGQDVALLGITKAEWAAKAPEIAKILWRHK